MRVSRPEAMAAHPSRCGGVASVNVASNQARTNGRNSGMSAHCTQRANQARTVPGPITARTIPAMRIVSIGGGPAGLYFAILMKQADRSHEILVVERNRADDTFGFGVVFSDATLEHFQAADRETHAAITRAFAHWNDIDTQY